ncbi:MAG: hypothetical protein J6Y19_08060, partial [Kiritimatiellae bacterium]|nr:hypothetical protein [Kiritimatiellia bacterium]
VERRRTMKRWFLNFAAVLAAGLLAGIALGEMIQVQVQKGNPVEPGYAAKVAAVLDAGTSGVDWVQPTWQVQEEIVHYVTGSTTNSVTNWIRVAGPTGTNALAEGDYVLPGDVFSTDGTNVIDVILEF